MRRTEKRNEEMEIYIPPGPRLGNVVIDAKKVAKSFGGESSCTTT